MRSVINAMFFAKAGIIALVNTGVIGFIGVLVSEDPVDRVDISPVDMADRFVANCLIEAAFEADILVVA
jgi:hypothetical protein